MITRPQRLFENIFDAEDITPTRLANFSADAINRFTRQNGDSYWEDLIDNLLQPTYTAFRSEIGDVDQAFNTRKGLTRTMAQVIVSFERYMLDEEPFLARTLGGKDAPAYIDFYPSGTPEYTDASKTHAHTLLDRADMAATTHMALLAPCGDEAEELSHRLYGRPGCLATGQGCRGRQYCPERYASRAPLELALLKPSTT